MSLCIRDGSVAISTSVKNSFLTLSVRERALSFTTPPSHANSTRPNLIRPRFPRESFPLRRSSSKNSAISIRRSTSTATFPKETYFEQRLKKILLSAFMHLSRRERSRTRRQKGSEEFSFTRSSISSVKVSREMELLSTAPKRCLRREKNSSEESPENFAGVKGESFATERSTSAEIMYPFWWRIPPVQTRMIPLRLMAVRRS